MATINKPICAVSLGVTGVPDCYFDVKKIKGMLLMKKTKSFSTANMADDDTFKSILQTAMLASGDDRIYPIFEFQSFTDNSEDVVKATSGYGNEKIAREGIYRWMWEMLAGGMCLQAQLRKFNFINKGWGIILVDENNQLFGRKDGTSLYPLDISMFYAHPPKLADGTNETKYMLEVNLPDKKQIIDSLGAYAFGAGYDVDDMLPGILALECYEVSTTGGSPNSTVIGVRQNCGKSNVYSDFATELAAVGVWTITNKATGASVVVSGAVTDAANQATTLTFTGAAGTYSINLASAATLAAASIGSTTSVGYEGIAVDITIT